MAVGLLRDTVFVHDEHRPAGRPKERLGLRFLSELHHNLRLLCGEEWGFLTCSHSVTGIVAFVVRFSRPGSE
jgi:hypothetical protein